MAKHPKKIKFRRLWLLLGAVLMILLWVFLQSPLKLTIGSEYKNLIEPTVLHPAPRSSEIPICENLLVKNWYAPHYSVAVLLSVSVKVSDPSMASEVNEILRKHRGLLKDRIRGVAAGVTLEQLKDPRLRVVKKGILNHVEAIVGPDVVEEILIPQWHIRRME